VPPKYHIHAEPVSPRVRPVGKLGIVDWREDCSNCHNCVKRGCVYQLYQDESDTLREATDYLDYIYQCKGCLNCVQDCTKSLLTRVQNPEYERLGDEYYTPEIILSTWYQSATGSIPVSGAGYGGPFSGAGFDSMWTDMSEIVRPTRDGIHGREYINTSVDIGRKLPHLAFEGACIVAGSDGAAGSSPAPDRIVPLLEASDALRGRGEPTAAMVMVPDVPEIPQIRSGLKQKTPDQIVAIRLPATPGAVERVRQLVHEGAEVINLVFDSHGRESAPARPRHMRDVIREVHGALVKDGSRDQVTLMSSGGIALPEHMAKAMICGVDLVGIDLPLMAALECRLCGECGRGESCPIDLTAIDADFAVRRMVNLMSAWHSQLIEMLGAMGIREVRRLRGETGRCMFFEDLERNTFGRLFGERKPQQETIRG